MHAFADKFIDSENCTISRLSRKHSFAEGKSKLPPSKPRFFHVVLATLAILSFLNLIAHCQALGASESILWSFDGTDGAVPAGGVILDASGTLYGTTFKGASGPGTVFELTKSRGKWTESVLLSFDGTDGENPLGALIMDTSGNLYGTTNGGGVNGAG